MTTAVKSPELLYTDDGGARQGPADLWCTYAAIRTLTWLDVRWQGQRECADFLLRCQNPDGGFAWQRGLPSDVWATYYCTQALKDMGRTAPRLAELGEWLDATQDDSGGFAMTVGQTPDVWATYYATRTYTEVLGRVVPRRERLRRWLGGLQQRDGGLGWYPAPTGSDTRACYYGAMAWRAAFGAAEPPWEVPALTRWIRDRQAPSGGFRFAVDSPEECLWATFRAVRALDALGGRPSDPQRCVDWIGARRDGGFVRWASYDTPDVWACFSAAGALVTLGAELAPPVRDEVARFVDTCRLPGGGFTYRAVADAGDALAASAAVLLGARGRADWLRAAHMPYEGGVMYMPGRGAEVRCTLWATSALAAAGGPNLDAGRIAAWLRHIQNPDGGFGFWHGRGSDMVATTSALETAVQLGLDPAAVIDGSAVEGFLASCRDGDAYRATPRGAVTAAATAQALRSLRLVGRPDAGRRALPVLDRFASRLGGYVASPPGVPDLVSTYQVVLAREQYGVPTPGLDRFLGRLRLGDRHYSWSILGRQPGGPLAECLGTALAAHGTAELPLLNL